MGHALYPHPQWAGLRALWEQLYPTHGLDHQRRTLLARLEAQMPAFVALLVNHRPRRLGGRTLPEVLEVGKRAPAQLALLFSAWARAPAGMYRARPTLVFAALGQARADGRLSPEDESVLVGKLLTFWALKTTLDTSYECAVMGTNLRDARTAAAAASQSPIESLTIH